MSCNNTNNTCSVDYFEFSAYTPVFLIGFFVNAAALWAIISIRGSWTSTHIYMLNLAVADFALILSLPFRIYDTFFCLPKTYVCTFLIQIHFVNMYASMLTMMAISCQRYLAIRFPLQTRSWRRKKETAVAVCFIIWALLVAVAVGFHHENNPEKLWSCYERRKDLPLSLKFLVLLVLVGFVLPLLITVFCSAHIIFILKHSSSAERKSLVGIVTANLIVFLVCYTPLHIAFVVNFLQTIPSNWRCLHSSLPAHWFLRVSEWISSTNCCFDSISYYFLLKKFYIETN